MATSYYQFDHDEKELSQVLFAFDDGFKQSIYDLDITQNIYDLLVKVSDANKQAITELEIANIDSSYLVKRVRQTARRWKRYIEENEEDLNDLGQVNVYDKPETPEINSKIEIPEEYNAVGMLRQSVDKGYELKQGLAGESIENTAERMGYDCYMTPVLTVSGWFSPVLELLKNNTHIKAVFVESVDRLARNINLTVNLVDYCMKNKIKIYAGSQVMNRGISKVTLHVMAIFAEFELVAKQTQFSSKLPNVIKFELNMMDYDDLNDEEKKLANILQYVEQPEVFRKAIEVSHKYIERYGKDTENAQKALWIIDTLTN